MKIGLISDTHGLLRDEVIERLKNCDMIIHAGDIGDKQIIDRLEKISRVEYIKGNCDKKEYVKDLDKDKIIEVYNKKIYIIHDIKTLDVDLKGKNIDIVIFGHSHKKDIYNKDGIIYINPGSVGPKRFKLPITLGILNIDNKSVDVKFINLD